MTWINIEFLDGQSPGPGRPPLDLSHDQLFRLASGFRQVFFLCIPYFQAIGSVFIDVAVYSPVSTLEGHCRRQPGQHAGGHCRRPRRRLANHRRPLHGHV